MGRSANDAVDVGLHDVEVDIESVEDFEVFAASQQVVDHLDVAVAFLLVSGGVAAYLDSSRVKWSILVLI